MKALISRGLSLIIIVLTDHLVKCFPKLCDQSHKPLDSITSVTQFVNDSYIITNHKFKYAISDGSGNVSLNLELGLKSPELMSFIVDFDEKCVNIEEVLFIVQVPQSNPEVPVQALRYINYTNDKWSDNITMNQNRTGIAALDHVQIELLNKVNLELYKSRFFVISFPSKGLLTIIRDQKISIFVRCNWNGGWQAEQVDIILGPDIPLEKIDSGFYDSTDDRVYLFHLKSLEGDHKPLRTHFYSCSYNFGDKSVTLSCIESNFGQPCEESGNIGWIKVIKVVALGVMTVAVLTLLVIISLMTCCKCNQKPVNDDNLPKTKSLTTGVSTPVTETQASAN